MIIFFGIYLPGGLQNIAASAIPNQIVQLGVDIAVFGLALIAAIYLIKFMSRHAMQQALGDILSGGGKNKLPMPKLGKTGERLALSAPVLYLICLEASMHIQGSASWWYMQMRDIITGLI